MVRIHSAVGTDWRRIPTVATGVIKNPLGTPEKDYSLA